MNQKQTITGIPSALQQAGVESTTYETDMLTMNELSGFYVARLHCLPQADPPELPDIRIPQQVGSCDGEDPAVLCLRPAEWLLISESPNSMEKWAQSIDNMNDKNTFLSDLSDGLAVFRLAGTGAPWLLNKLSGLDFQSGVHAGDHCARTRMGQVATVIHFHRTHNGPAVFDLIFDRSIAKYLWELICASSPHANELATTYGEAA